MGIKLELTIAETNTVLQCLAKQPFELVSGIINKIQAQGGPQVEAVEKEEAEAKAAETQTPAAE